MTGPMIGAGRPPHLPPAGSGDAGPPARPAPLPPGGHADLARSLHGHVTEHGGFTVHRRTHQPLGEGVSVGADPGATLRMPWHQWDHELVADWVHHHARRCDRDDLHLGGWLDPHHDVVWLDLVHVYPPSARREALLTGLRHQQHAVFDIGARSVVVVAGLTAVGIDALMAGGFLGATG